MSIGADPMSNNPISAQTVSSSGSTTPLKRQVRAKADAKAQPEPR